VLRPHDGVHRELEVGGRAPEQPFDVDELVVGQSELAVERLLIGWFRRATRVIVVALGLGGSDGRLREVGVTRMLPASSFVVLHGVTIYRLLTNHGRRDTQ